MVTVSRSLKIEANSINLIFADQPYWMRVSGVLKRVEGTDYDGCADEWDNQFESLDDYSEFTRNWLKECYRVLSPNGSIWVIGECSVFILSGILCKKSDIGL